MSVLHRASLLRALPLLLLGACLCAGSARAALVYHLLSAHAQAGATVELEGLLVNETGNPLASPVAAQLQGQWTNSLGQTSPVRFQLRTSPDAVNLPANTFTRMIWTGGVPQHVQGLLTLQLDGAPDTLLVLKVEPPGSATGTMAATANGAQPALAPDATRANGLSPFETFRSAISSYEPIYLALGNKGGANARFQVSFKYRLLSPPDPARPSLMDDWYFGYTQTALWDLHSDSIPFVDTTYNPSLFWARESLWNGTDKRWFLGLNTGFEHRSNGKAGDDSRSINDLYVQPEFNYRFDGGSTLSFRPRFKYYVLTDRDMHYPDYQGYVDWKLRWAQDDGWVLSALVRQGSGGRNATQLEAAWPLKRTFLHMNGHLYLQYFRGYGETLLGYDQKSEPQLRIGIALVP